MNYKKYFCILLTKNTAVQITTLILFIAFIAWLTLNWKKKKKPISQSLANEFKIILNTKVLFYQQLNESEKIVFENKMQQFLSQIKITGVGTNIEPEDEVLVAASAIIPIFGFKHWEYNNLNEVLLYPASFNQEFEIKDGQQKSILGMVGSGAMERVMILSKPALREGFYNNRDKNNTGIHEFVHLLDKTDGEVDGIPENLLDKQYILPWINLMHNNIKEIMAGKSDINPYGATNKAEFFAVVSEYFFKRPDLLKAKHPELYLLLELIFRQVPVKEGHK